MYFCCLEALQNATKHARGASGVSIALWDNGALHFEVRDEGQGLSDQTAVGAGFTNMKDRLAALGGHLDIDSEPDRGTCVTGTIPSPRRS